MLTHGYEHTAQTTDCIKLTFCTRFYPSDQDKGQQLVPSRYRIASSEKASFGTSILHRADRTKHRHGLCNK